MPVLSNILTRIKYILLDEKKKNKIYDKDVAEALGINQLTLATMKKRKKIPYEEILDFCAKKKISINWLFYDQIIESLQLQTQKLINIKYFKNIYASAGGGAQNYDICENVLQLDKQMLVNMNIKDEKNIQAINILGDSMEPTLSDGNIVFIDTSKISINKGGIFVLSTPAGVFVKRLQIKSNKSIDLISDNKAYANENVMFEDIKILGKVVGSVHFMD